MWKCALFGSLCWLNWQILRQMTTTGCTLIYTKFQRVMTLNTKALHHEKKATNSTQETCRRPVHKRTVAFYKRLIRDKQTLVMSRRLRVVLISGPTAASNLQTLLADRVKRVRSIDQFTKDCPSVAKLFRGFRAAFCKQLTIVLE